MPTWRSILVKAVNKLRCIWEPNISSNVSVSFSSLLFCPFICPPLNGSKQWYPSMKLKGSPLKYENQCYWIKDSKINVTRCNGQGWILRGFRFQPECYYISTIMGISSPRGQITSAFNLVARQQWNFPSDVGTLYSHLRITSVSTLVGCGQFKPAQASLVKFSVHDK